MTYHTTPHICRVCKQTLATRYMQGPGGRRSYYCDTCTPVTLDGLNRLIPIPPEEAVVPPEGRDPLTKAAPTEGRAPAPQPAAAGRSVGRRVVHAAAAAMGLVTALGDAVRELANALAKAEEERAEWEQFAAGLLDKQPAPSVAAPTPAATPVSTGGRCRTLVGGLRCRRVAGHQGHHTPYKGIDPIEGDPRCPFMLPAGRCVRAVCHAGHHTADPKSRTSLVPATPPAKATKAERAKAWPPDLAIALMMANKKGASNNKSIVIAPRAERDWANLNTAERAAVAKAMLGAVVVPAITRSAKRRSAGKNSKVWAWRVGNRPLRVIVEKGEGGAYRMKRIVRRSDRAYFGGEHP